jgi:tetratricopeptide (TPR) repeat protein
MMVKKNILGIFTVISCSFIFSKTDILWDFGVIIKSTDHQDVSINIPIQATTQSIDSFGKINAVISDPFIHPTKQSLTIQKSKLTSYVSNNLAILNYEKNIFLIISDVKRFFFKKNYKYVIEMINHIDLSDLSPGNQHDLEYLLSYALYKTGNYQKARDQILSSLQDHGSDRLYFLLAMIYESLEKNNMASIYYLKLINHYPESDYTTSANIKIDMLD